MTDATKRIAELEAALREIANQDAVENMLDPQWAARIAIAALAGEATAAPRLTDAEIFDIADPYGEFRYGDAQGDKRLEFARAIEAKVRGE